MPEVAPYARAAYAQGWAASGGPMTDRVKAGCIAAVEWAEENADAPDVLEVALKLGSLEGTWALVFDRRDKLIAKHTALIQKAWNDSLTTLDVGLAIRRLRHAAGFAEEARDRTIWQIAKDAMVSLLSWLPGTMAWQAVRFAMGDAISSGTAEGKVGALALAWEQSGHVSMDFDIAFKSAYEALANLGQTWAAADGWLGQILDRQTDDLGRALADLASSGAGYDEMLAAAERILTGASGDAVSFVTDWALNTAMTQGAFDLYMSEGVQQISFMTAGDLRVCVRCETAGEESPYAPADLPKPPLHPRCRCTISADITLPGSLTQALAVA